MVVLAILFIWGNKGVDMYQSYQKEQAIKDSIEQLRQDSLKQDSLKQDSIRKEQAKADSLKLKFEEMNKVGASATPIKDNSALSDTDKKVSKNSDMSSKKTETPSVNKETNRKKSQPERLHEVLNSPFNEKIGGLTTLANENYPPAYLPYAEMLIHSGNSTEAKKYLRLSIQNGVNVQRCTELLEILEN